MFDVRLVKINCPRCGFDIMDFGLRVEEVLGVKMVVPVLRCPKCGLELRSAPFVEGGYVDENAVIIETAKRLLEKWAYDMRIAAKNYWNLWHGEDVEVELCMDSVKWVGRYVVPSDSIAFPLVVVYGEDGRDVDIVKVGTRSYVISYAIKVVGSRWTYFDPPPAISPGTEVIVDPPPRQVIIARVIKKRVATRSDKKLDNGLEGMRDDRERG